jgi:hypothetical protein
MLFVLEESLRGSLLFALILPNPCARDVLALFIEPQILPMDKNGGIGRIQTFGGSDRLPKTQSKPPI